MSWPRELWQRRVFAWLPVRLVAGDWAWMRSVLKVRIADRRGDLVFERNVYVL